MNLLNQTGVGNVKLPQNSDPAERPRRFLNPGNITIRLQPQMKK